MAGNTGTVISTDSASDADGHAVDVIVDLGGGQTISAELANPTGVDARPLPGDAAALVDANPSGGKRAVAFFDSRSEPKATDGEWRAYGRDSDGNTVCEVWLKKNGEIQITNFKAQPLTISSQGPVVIESAVNDIRLGAGGQRLARVGDFVVGTVKALSATAGLPITIAPPGTLGVPVALQIVSGIPGITGG